ncbi:MAG: UPF0182 family protein [Hydrococcus sp. Prado102]|jgi:hypothetical protein|nr:UPF0182 family protein [Hydrococcus sp. Prado102]
MWKRNFRPIILLLGLWLGIELICRIGGEILWYEEVDYLSVYLIRLFTKSAIAVTVFAISISYLLFNLFLAQRLKYPHLSTKERVLLDKRKWEQYPQRKKSHVLKPVKLTWLLPLVLGLALLIGLLLVHYGQIVFNYWYGDPGQAHATSLVPTRFRLETIWQLGNQMVSGQWYLIGAAGGAIAILVYPSFWLRAIALVLSFLIASILSEHWDKVLPYFHPTSFNASEAVFNQDISFYIFTLPIWELLELWLTGLTLYGFVSVGLVYLLSGDSLSQGSFPGFSKEQLRHLCGLGGCLMLAVAFSFWLSRYELLFSTQGASYGASYTDANVQLPANTLLSILALGIAIALLASAIFAWRSNPNHRLLFYGLGFYAIVIVGIGIVLPTAVQYLVVQPNELEREQPYIARTIALTRQAFGLANIDEQNFDPQGQLTQADLRRNELTIRNIRLWDQRPLLETNRQLQQIRLYYRFPDADIDRYTLVRNGEAPSNENDEQRQVLIAARELDYSAVPQQAKTWVNRHLIYTHGYGFTLSPVNTVAPGGLPEYFVRDIGVGEEGALTVTSEAVRDSIPIENPRIYYGEITNNYVMTPTSVKELDYPSGSENVYYTYSGQGGINIAPLWRRLLFAKYLNDWRTIFTPEFTPETKVLFRRNINQRIRAIAPFLRYDSDPYLVAADTQEPASKPPSSLYWIIDAYMTSDRYPYSAPTSEGINYIRNSVKVVVDAYHGSVDFYVADKSDPIVNTWSAIFPNLFKPLDAMPESLRGHIRYPVDFFKIQSEQLMTYHMTDPQVFYNREDQWQIPNEVYGDKPQLVEPYYLITSLPKVPFEEFLLLLPYTPQQRTNLIAWLAARSDGNNYGKLLLYIFPKQRLVYGPEQIEARINQDPVISQQITLWNRQGSRVIQGNLLVIPIEQSLLYVEPLYLEATQNSLPTLVRVIVAYENRIVMTQTLEQSLQAIFQEEETPAPIIRPVEAPVTQ